MINVQAAMKEMLVKGPRIFSCLCFITVWFRSQLRNENEIQDLGDIIELELRMASSSSLSIV